MTNRFRIAVMALSTAVVAVGASALHTPEARAARICSNTACMSGGGDACAYQAAYYCVITKSKDAAGHIQYSCTEGQC